MQKNILVIGESGHGKSSFGKALSKELNHPRFYPDIPAIATHYSTSDFVIHRLAQKLGIKSQTIKNDKEHYRQQLIDYGNLMCDADPGILVAACQFACYTNICIIDGVRRINEFKAVRDTFDHIFYIDRPGYKSVVDNFELHNLKDSPEVAIKVINTEDINVLYEVASSWASELNLCVRG